MRLSCPACGATISLDAAIGHEGAREAIQIALRLPASLGKTLLLYIGLFRPAQRNLSMDRVANLLNELLPMIEAAKIERNGKQLAAPLDYWAQALNEMINKRESLTLPLKSHGYLLTIIAGYADKAEFKVEQRTEQTRSKGKFFTAGQPKKRQAPVKLSEILKTGKDQQ
ncbi:hypothetical protein [Methylobacillus flagellatus]|uniref:Uncharacterized protein n=1 Tax=Methylobacillus flagellatus (strain ATCC 51484 / DSM 6875 / VKM B-1610 / KT) TaxID=265072 RepID=Q1GXQ4_METFK|nr:hypothetical protein [Methylobacillus flagellatus]ABE50983.1 conserved hypothetical protein [Methylobacillus flagellatus KT]